MPYTPKDATPATVKANRDAVARYAMEDRQDFTDADRGFIAGFPGQVLGPDGQVIFDLADYEYLADDARVPDTVNPSLWRQSQVMHRGGLYKVVDGLFQARNNDIANLTIVEGDDGRPRSSSLTWTPPAGGSMSTALNLKTPARRLPTGSTASWGRSSRSTRNSRVASTSC